MYFVIFQIKISQTRNGKYRQITCFKCLDYFLFIKSIKNILGKKFKEIRFNVVHFEIDKQISFVIKIMKQIGILSFMHYKNNNKTIFQINCICRFLVEQKSPGIFCTISYRLLPPPWSANVAVVKLRHSRIHTFMLLKKFLKRGCVCH